MISYGKAMTLMELLRLTIPIGELTGLKGTDAYARCSMPA